MRSNGLHETVFSDTSRRNLQHPHQFKVQDGQQGDIDEEQYEEGIEDVVPGVVLAEEGMDVGVIKEQPVHIPEVGVTHLHGALQQLL